MYDLPENPTVSDIIVRSLTCHPSLFRDCILSMRKTHYEYFMNSPDNSLGKIGAKSALQHCDLVLKAIDENDSAIEQCAAIAESTGAVIQAMTIARKLQCLPHHICKEALERISAPIETTT